MGSAPTAWHQSPAAYSVNIYGFSPWLSQAISSGPVGSIAETLTPLLAALRIVWAISRYYGSDERMAALLQRIAHAILERCKEAVQVKVGQQSPAGPPR